ncbi:DUF167 domain-containing protein [Sphingomicrobium nitratireducens]|uniref:DUF167 domain-containing protein n=1 Tax=Sphingomicrobium nitratireducens TaxID=2964666 RepID=UPI00223EC647|nr:DUF167 domain-containing protein [Sphingomicrobium nitratireducens]
MEASSIIAVRVTPRSARPGVGGWRPTADGREALEVRVAAAPADGAANAELVKLLAKALSVPKSAIDIVSGETSRLKRVSVPLATDEIHMRLG